MCSGINYGVWYGKEGEDGEDGLHWGEQIKLINTQTAGSGTGKTAQNLASAFARCGHCITADMYVFSRPRLYLPVTVSRNRWKEVKVKAKAHLSVIVAEESKFLMLLYSVPLHLATWTQGTNGADVEADCSGDLQLHILGRCFGLQYSYRLTLDTHSVRTAGLGSK